MVGPPFTETLTITLQPWRRVLLAATTVLMVFLVAGVDLATGEELSFFVFYFIPVGFAAWTLNPIWGIGAAFLCTIGWLAVETLSGHQYSHAGLLFANTVIRWSSYTLMAHFVSKLRQFRIELRRYARELENRVAHRTLKLEERVGELEMFSYSVSHNLRAPLRAMEGMAHAVEDSLPPQARTSEISEFLHRIKSAAVRMDRLILDLVEYVQLTIREPELRPTLVAPLVAEVLEDQREVIERKQARVVVATEMPPVWGHNRMLHVVLLQLLSNSLKFAAPGRPPIISIASEYRDGTWVRFSIQDNGVGIDPAYHDRVFGLFEQLDSTDLSGRGTGMGLAIAKKCVEKMGGKIGLESPGAEGTKFWFELKNYQRAPSWNALQK